MMVKDDQDLKVQFETVSCASNGTTASGVACGNALVAAGVDGVVGAALSGVTEGLISVCAPAQIPVVSYASTAESLSGQSFFFRTVPSDNEQVRRFRVRVTFTVTLTLPIVSRLNCTCKHTNTHGHTITPSTCTLAHTRTITHTHTYTCTLASA